MAESEAARLSDTSSDVVDLQLDLKLGSYEEKGSSLTSLEKQGESSKVFYCKYCTKKFYNPSALGGHQNLHKRERSFDARRQGRDLGAFRYNPYCLQPYFHVPHMHSGEIPRQGYTPEPGVGYFVSGDYHGGFPVPEVGRFNPPTPTDSAIALSNSSANMARGLGRYNIASSPMFMSGTSSTLASPGVLETPGAARIDKPNGAPMFDHIGVGNGRFQLETSRKEPQGDPEELNLALKL